MNLNPQERALLKDALKDIKLGSVQVLDESIQKIRSGLQDLVYITSDLVSVQTGMT